MGTDKISEVALLTFHNILGEEWGMRLFIRRVEVVAKVAALIIAKEVDFNKQYLIHLKMDKDA